MQSPSEPRPVEAREPHAPHPSHARRQPLAPRPQRLDLPTLVFDGSCSFCTWFARFVLRRARTRMRAVPWQTAHLPHLGLTPIEGASSAWWIEPTGVRHSGYAAIAASLRACRGPWRLLGRLIASAPLRWLSRRVYVMVERMRQDLPGAVPALDGPWHELSDACDEDARQGS